jgi:hypothetical protein
LWIELNLSLQSNTSRTNGLSKNRKELSVRYYERYNLKRDDAIYVPTTPLEVVDSFARTSNSTQNGNGQHSSPDQKIIKLSDGYASPQFQEEARARLEASCINHCRPPIKKRQESMDALHMTEEEFYAWKPGQPAARPEAMANRDEYLRMLEEMGANIEKPPPEPLGLNTDCRSGSAPAQCT